MEMMVKGAGTRFSLDALIKITDDFSEDNTLVKSEHFNIFRGKIDQQLEQITVKIWHSDDKLHRFREEITILGHPRMLSCPNIVKLTGYCCEGDLVASIYELQSVDTLENLFDKDEFQWRDRMIAALGIAHMFRCIGVQGISHRIHATLPCYILLDQERNPVLCDVQMLTGGSGTRLLDKGGAHSSLGNDACFSGEDMTADKMKPNGIFALGMLLLRLIRVRRHVFEDVKTKLPYVGYPTQSTLTRLSPSNSQLKSQSFFYQCDCNSVISLADQCLDYDEKRLKISQVIETLENLLLFSLPVRTSCGKVAVGGSKLVYFTYNDLCELTDKFSVENLFAITQFGEAYRGRIQQGWKKMGAQDIIVKMWGKLNFSADVRVSKTSSSMEDNICRLRDEVIMLTQRWIIDNPNVVNLLGYCFEDLKVGIVYSAQPLYTLESLFDDEWFEWKDRIVAALELARTIALFHGKEQQYVVLNISAAHIMIDQDKKPILYDFSMLHGQVLSGQRAARTLRVMGSIDCIDPYLVQSGLVVPQSDIFAFGVLLMSLICKRDMSTTIKTFGHKHIEDRFKSKPSVVHENFVTLPFFDHHDGCKLTKLAFDCIDADYLWSRPTASNIVKQLESLSLFSDTPFSTEVNVKVIDSYSNIERKQSWRKHLRLFKKLSIIPKKLKDQSCIPTGKEIIEGPRIFRPVIFETTPEEIHYRIQRIDAFMKPEMEKEETHRESLRNMVKYRQSDFIKRLVVV